jgi:MtrB/PioB family decaheme-associated outer membrane protein
MNIGSQGLRTRRAILLGSAMFAALPFSAALAADQPPPVLKAPPADVVGWYFFGDLEVGGRAFIQRPPSGFGRAPPPDNWLTPRTSESRAKFEEYGEILPGLYLDYLHVGAGSKDGLYAVDLWAKNVGYNNQSYLLSMSKAGEHYLAVGWDQTPHLISTSAKTVFGGAGTANLTVDPTLRANLQANARNATASGAAGVTARTNIEGFVNGAATGVTLSTQRKTGTVDYRYTPDSNWEFRVDYSNEHRTGTRPLNVNFGYAFGAAAGFASNFIEAIQPIDDRTQNVNVSAQYVGTSLWGKRWVSNLIYSGSFFDNSLKSFDTQNPFCITCLTGAGPGDRGPNLLRMSLAPSNMANALTFNNSLDLPWQSRYTGTVQYNVMRQNDPFVNTATNGLVPAPLPTLSANARMDTLLANNTITTQLTNDLKSTLRYRYYDVDNRTPENLYTNYVSSDTSIAAGPRRNLAIAYTKQNASEELSWRATRWLNVGGFYGWEQYDRTRRDANVTNEHTGKLFADAEIWGGGRARGSVSYSQRRYQLYDAAALVDDIGLQFSENLAAMRKFDLANRDRLKADVFVDIPVDDYLTITPTVGMRDDRYPTDIVNQLGISRDKGWNAGLDVSGRIGPYFKGMVGYNYEVRDRSMSDCCGGAAGGLIPANIWSSEVQQKYHTFTASADWKVIPDKLDLRLQYLLALGSEANDTTPCASGAAGCTGTGTGVTTTQFPTERNSFQRLSAIGSYYVDPDFVQRMGWVGNVVVRLRYTYERNRTENWAIDNMTPYIPTPDQTADLTGGGRSLFLAAFNPNYTAQIIAASVAVKW